MTRYWYKFRFYRIRRYLWKALDVGFRKDHKDIKNYIQRIYPEGGCSNFQEDAALALELALKKDWKDKVKLAEFIDDAPGHGEKYGDHNIL